MTISGGDGTDWWAHVQEHTRSLGGQFVRSEQTEPHSTTSGGDA